MHALIAKHHINGMYKLLYYDKEFLAMVACALCKCLG